MGVSIPRKFRRVGDEVIEKYGDQLKPDFDYVKKFLGEIGLYPDQISKKVRNWIAGYIVRKLKRMQAS